MRTPALVVFERGVLHAAMTEWVDKWKRNGWQTAQAEPVKNKEDITKLYSACQKINVKWVSEHGLHRDVYIQSCV